MGLLMGSRSAKETRVRPALEGASWGGEEPTALFLRDTECRVAPVQDGALRADTALTQHLALLWVQWSQHPILASLRGLTGCYTCLVYRVTGAEEGCRNRADTRPRSDPRQGEEGP